MSRKKRSYKWKDFTLDERFTITSLIVACIFLEQSYILALLGKDPMEQLACLIVSAVIAVQYKYSVKSFYGKREEENMKLKRELEGLSQANINDLEDFVNEN